MTEHTLIQAKEVTKVYQTKDGFVRLEAGATAAPKDDDAKDAKIDLAGWSLGGMVLATSDAQGRIDATPRGGAPGFVKVPDDHTLLLGDAPGNNRLDALQNLLDNPRAGLLFMVPGVDETLRVNGRVVLSTDPADVAACSDGRRLPKVVLRLTVEEAFLHCAKACMRSRLWHADAQVERERLPTMGQMIHEQIGLDAPPETQAQMLARYQQDL